MPGLGLQTGRALVWFNELQPANSIAVMSLSRSLLTPMQMASNYSLFTSDGRCVQVRATIQPIPVSVSFTSIFISFDGIALNRRSVYAR